eukprot:2059326-Rhodomonas_salina.1
MKGHLREGAAGGRQESSWSREGGEDGSREREREVKTEGAGSLGERRGFGERVQRGGGGKQRERCRKGKGGGSRCGRERVEKGGSRGESRRGGSQLRFRGERQRRASPGRARAMHSCLCWHASALASQPPCSLPDPGSLTHSGSLAPSVPLSAARA